MSILKNDCYVAKKHLPTSTMLDPDKTVLLSHIRLDPTRMKHCYNIKQGGSLCKVAFIDYSPGPTVYENIDHSKCCGFY